MSENWPEAALRARELYAQGLPVSKILAETKLSLAALYAWVDGGPPDGPRDGPPGEPTSGSARLAAIPRRRAAASSAVRTNREALAGRLWRTAERQVRQIEARLRIEDREPAERERDARVLAVLVRTLRDLAAFDDGAAPAINETADAHGPTRDLDQFRRDLARRMDALVASRSSDRVSG